jgi:hypothetical protein
MISSFTSNTTAHGFNREHKDAKSTFSRFNGYVPLSTNQPDSVAIEHSKNIRGSLPQKDLRSAPVKPSIFQALKNAPFYISASVPNFHQTNSYFRSNRKMKKHSFSSPKNNLKPVPGKSDHFL